MWPCAHYNIPIYFLSILWFISFSRQDSFQSFFLFTHNSVFGMEAPPTNDTEEIILNDGLRHARASYLIFIVVSSFIGDSTILIASIRYKAFKLHKLIVVVIQHIAACDIMVSVCLIPQIVGIIAHDWELGELMCYFLLCTFRTTLTWQGITTTILIAIVYCISLLPFCIYRIFAAHVPDTPGNIFHLEFRRFATSIIIYLNTTCNFYIYCLTVCSFREFFLKKLNLYHQKSNIVLKFGDLQEKHYSLNLSNFKRNV